MRAERRLATEDEMMGRHDEREIDPKQYQTRFYQSLGRFVSYWHQVDEVRRVNPATVLEIGPGNGFVADYLRRLEYDVVTLDVNQDLIPDVVGSITAMPFDDGSFDVVTACEVIEHLPFDLVKTALAEVRRVTRAHVILSIPDKSPSFRCHISATGIRPLQFFAHAGVPMPKRLLSLDHEWELGLRGFPMRRLKSVIRDAGLCIERTYRVFQNTTCRFFVVTKQT